MENSSGMAFGILAAVMAAGVAVVVIVVVVARATRRRKGPSAGAGGEDAATPASAPRPAPAASASATPQAPPAAPPAVGPMPRKAPPAPLEQVMLEVEGMLLGAIPPFGTLTFDDGVARFSAHSRIVAATASGLLGNDGGSTMQSMGSMEIGDFVVEFPLDGATVSDEPDGGGLRVVSAGRSGRLAAVRSDHGRIRDALSAARPG